MTLAPSRDEFLSRAGTKRIPVIATLLADTETPLSAYWKLAHREQVSFLLESVTGGEHVARYSVLGVKPINVVRSTGRTVTSKDTSWTLQEGEDPLSALRSLREALACEHTEGLPKFFGGAVGYLGYDFVRFIERLPDGNPDPIGLPDMAMMLCESVVVFDHARSSIMAIVLAEPTSEGYDAALTKIDEMVDILLGPLPELPMGTVEGGSVMPHTSKEDFESAVRKVIDYITAGDGIQMVLSQRFSKATSAHPVSIYRALRSLNPSPYMFLMRFGDFDLVGASPELLVSLLDHEARVRPIAGTRKRGKNEAEDLALEAELLADEKEKAEHIMLVDLGRNDLGKVCEVGTVTVPQIMVVERYSHVMHIVSDVRGRMAASQTVEDLIRATFPAGTLSGAPKVRAMEIIEELEPLRRGVYGGAVGFITPDGDADLAIAIRSIVLKNGIAHVQAGAGIVYDSVPEKEWQECHDKASAPLKAIELAEAGL